MRVSRKNRDRERERRERRAATSLSMGLRNKNECVASHIKCRQLVQGGSPGHPWGVSEIAATYLNKTLYRGAIRPPIRIPTSIQINKLSCNECAALQGQPPRLTNCPTSSLPNVPVYIL